MAKYKVILPDQGRSLAQQSIPPFGTLVDSDEAFGSAPLPEHLLNVYRREDGSTFAAYRDEVEPVYTQATVDVRQPRDVTVEAVGAKATFTGAEAKVGAYAVAFILAVLAVGYVVAGCTVINNHGSVTITTEKK